MPQINRLSSSDDLAVGDLLAVYIVSKSDTRKVSISTLIDFLNGQLNFNGGAFETQYAAPSATGFSVQIEDGSDNVHLILTPLAGFAAGTIVLPDVGNAVDKQEVLVNCTQQVNALTIDGNGAAAVVGAPSVLAADDFFRLKYDAPFQNWYRVG